LARPVTFVADAAAIDDQNLIHMTNEVARIEFEMQTPLWTGGVSQRGDLGVHTTGILGGMRWWLEALLRGVGANAPDPVAHPSVFDSQKGETGGLDAASLLFGATGYRRRFRLMVTSKVLRAPVEKVELRDLSHPLLNHAGEPITNPDGTPKLKIPTWFFNSTPVKGKLVLQITPLHEDCNAPLVTDLLSFMAKWGTLGARAQMGFGVAKSIRRRDRRRYHAAISEGSTGKERRGRHARTAPDVLCESGGPGWRGPGRSGHVSPQARHPSAFHQSRPAA
jgi:CRISPR type III-B/RAMP module RAMP protein Cmr1